MPIEPLRQEAPQGHARWHEPHTFCVHLLQLWPGVFRGLVEGRRGQVGELVGTDVWEVRGLPATVLTVLVAFVWWWHR